MGQGQASGNRPWPAAAAAVGHRLAPTLLMATTALGLLLSPLASYGQALPSGGEVSHGDAVISMSGSSLLVTQLSQNAILHWDSFAVGAGAAVHFDNGAGATLNRVTGNLPTTIDGALSATGSLYMVNPAGIAVGTGGMVRTGGSFVASTLDLSDADFLAGGNMVLSGTSRAGVTNAGVIASLGGDVVLTARRVENSGTILASQGDVGLLAGYEVLLRDLATDEGRFAVRIGGPDTEVVNTGTIAAANAELRANGGNVYALAGNMDGVVTATGVSQQGGRIFLTAGEGGSVTATQRIVARPAPVVAPVPQQRPASLGGMVRISAGQVTLGGKIDVSGDAMAGGTIIAVAREQLNLAADARLDASGTDGGLILLGGDYQGGAAAQNNYWHEAIGTTLTTLVAEGATIRADGLAGAGGNVVIWGDEHTGFAGQVTATGITHGGDAEVSGKATLAFAGSADLRGANGTFGTLLLDPYNFIIADAPGNPSMAPDREDSVINATTLMAALETASITLSTGNAGDPGAQAGDIRVLAPLSWSSGSVLTLLAARSIAIDAPITIGGAGGLTLNYDTVNGSLSFAGGVQYTGTPNSGQSLTIAGTPYTLLHSLSDLQGINTDAGLGGSYALARSLDAAGHTGWIPLGTDGTGVALNSGSGFTGHFTGLGNSISNLDIDIGTYSFAGLFGRSAGTLSDVGLRGGSVKGDSYVGGLVGWQGGSGVTRSYATGAVTGTGNYAGGLVGVHRSGSITQSYATGTVTGDGDVGGLVGWQAGNITQSYATGAVTGTGNYAGGLVGWQAGGDITQSYATGTVTGTASGGAAGGLVGFQGNSGSIAQSYATGAVTGSGGSAGGLVGWQVHSGSIAQSYATGAVTGSNDVGGLVGFQGNSGSVSNSYWDIYSTNQGQAVGNAPNHAGVTSVTSDPALSGAANYAYRASAYGNLGSVATTLNAGADWYVLDRQTRPFGAWEYSTAIGNGHQLQLVNMDLRADYTMVRSIDLAGAFPGAGIALPTPAQSAGMWRGGFVPLGTDGAGGVLNAGAGFAGRFAGRGNAIANLVVDIGTSDYAGLFGRATGTISDVGLLGGSVKGGYYVGGLVGTQAGGSITQSYASVVVAGNYYTGGVVGYQGGGDITQSYATGAITGSGGAVGGLVGYQVGGEITQSYATGAITGNRDVGGLVGAQSGSITRSHATGAVTGTIGSVGGLVGYQGGGDITQSYATGAVTGTGEVGGLVGMQHAGHVSNSFWDRQTTGQQAGRGSFTIPTTFEAQGLTTVAMRNPFSFIDAGWDFAAIWGKSQLGENNDYMMLHGVGPGTLYSDYVRVAGGYVSRAYGSANPSLTPYVTIAGSGVANVSIDWGSAAGQQANVGSYTFSAPGVVDIAATSPGEVYVEYGLGTLAVTPAPLIISARDVFRTYDGLGWGGGNGVTYAGFVNGEDASVLGGALVYGGAAQGAVNTGSYTLSAGGLTSGNYNIIYADGTLAIAQRFITVSADDLTRLYGDANPALTWTVGGMGLANGDTLSGDLATMAIEGSGVGAYAINRGSLAAGANYAVIFNPGTLRVTPRSITVAADDLRRRIGMPDPALSWTITAGSLVGMDSVASVFSGQLLRAAGERPGAYVIGQGSLLANANYDLTFRPGTFSIDARAIATATMLERSLPFAVTALSDPVPFFLCESGVLTEVDCAAFVHPANRDIDSVGFGR